VSLLIPVRGAYPGMGESTLCAGLVRRLAERGETVEWFRKQDVLSRPEFADVAREFAADGRVARHAFHHCADRVLETVLKRLEPYLEP
jgi:hypothetical protein